MIIILSSAQNDTISLIIQILGLLICIIFTAIVKRKTPAIIFSILIMTAANIIGQIIFAGGGPGACMGFFALPTIGVCAVYLTLYVLKEIKK